MRKIFLLGMLLSVALGLSAPMALAQPGPGYGPPGPPPFHHYWRHHHHWRHHHRYYR